ncbi:MAG: PAS domain-containing protein [Ardenticatenaceae bacterium]|nr:PAS domain-containing protein [Ardenticatenaceae bacterium]
MARALVDIRILQREYLLAISRALTAELDLHDLLRVILKASVEFVSGRAGLIALAEPGTRRLRVAAVYGIPPDLVDHFAPLLQELPRQDGEGEEEDAAQELGRRLREVMGKANLGLTQAIRLPLVSRGEVIGLIYVFQSGNYYFVEDARSLLRSFAEQAAIAVRNAQLYQQINNEKQRLDAILEQSADGVMILDPSLEIQVFNKALSHMTGWWAEEAIGQHHDDVIQWRSLKTKADLNDAIADGWPLPGAAHIYVEGDLQRPKQANHLEADGERVSLGITYAPLVDENGRMINIIANVRDLTRYREEEALQKTFISVISHELKTPVSIIKGYAGTLRRQDANWSPEVVRDSLLVIEEEADNLTDLIDNLLETSRLQAGTFHLEISEEVMLPWLADKVVRKFANQAEKHTFWTDFPSDFMPVTGDERRLTQVLNNLVSNAIKYSPDGGLIKVWGEVHPQHVTVSVSDEGIGIPDHEKPRIFQKFSRLDNALSRKTEGTGLGLYLTKAIIEAHNGRIWFSNNSDGPGTTFTFSLPRDDERQQD